MGFCGQNFTWSRGLKVYNHVAKRLDRVLMNNDGRLPWPEVFVHHLPKYGSDHTPLLLSLKHQGIKIREGVLLGLRQLGFPIPIFTLSSIRTSQRIALLLPPLLNSSLRCPNQNWSACYRWPPPTECTSLSELDLVLNQEELLWHQKSRELWLQGGVYKSTSFFHTSMIIRRKLKLSRTLRAFGCLLKSYFPLLFHTVGSQQLMSIDCESFLANGCVEVAGKRWVLANFLSTLLGDC
ncbi:hypothetical protein V2J09_016932 [Rumex salicifolius]